MGKEHPKKGKQRTRQHVIADLSVHHLEGFILAAGHTAPRVGPDYGYDLTMFTYDADGYAEPGGVLFQLKASESLARVGGNYVFDLDIRDYNLWTRDVSPVILVLYDAGRNRAYWIHAQGYFDADPNRRPRKGAKTVRVRVPVGQRVTLAAIETIRGLKPVPPGPGSRP